MRGASNEGGAGAGRRRGEGGGALSPPARAEEGVWCVFVCVVSLGVGVVCARAR